jgi:hypothetical protein
MDRLHRLPWLLLLLLIAVGCQISNNVPIPGVTPTSTTAKPTPIPIAERQCPDFRSARRESTGTVRLQEGQPAVENQVILIGLGRELDQVVRDPRVQRKELGQQPAASISLGFLAEFPPREGYQVPFPEDRIGELEIRLYTVGAGTVGEAIDDIVEVAAELRDAGAIESGVFADPNFITGDPWSVGGDPWSVGGDPWSVGGDPEAMAAAGQALFRDQWAFQKIELFDSSGVHQAAAAGVEGQDVRVAIFDTSPFPDDGAWQLPWSDPTLELCVHHPIPFQAVTDTKKADLSDHGLFVAGLAHAVAPRGDYHLIRVLNEQAEGDLFWLLEGLTRFTEQQLAEQGTLENTVINLSLGLEGPLEETDFTLNEENRRLLREWGLERLPSGDDAAAWDTIFPVLSLEVPLALIHSYGGVVVAASGNDSANIAVPPDAPAATQIPAAYPFVTGVAASAEDGTRACFSNQAHDVAAPGGQGGPGTGGACVSQVSTCDAQQSCAYGLLSYSLHSSSGYYYGAGTSFATPLVSGLAALLLSDETSPSPDQVAQEIESNVIPPAATEPNLGKGIINVPGTLP